MKLQTYSPPDRLMWCGEDAIVILAEQRITLVGPKGDTFVLCDSDVVAMTSEIDSLRVLFPNRSCLLYRRTKESISADNCNLSKFYDALQNEDIMSAKHILSTPTEDICDDALLCLEAAKNELDTNKQLRLLRIADLGRGYLPTLLCHDVVEAINILRILNNLRAIEVGIYMTFPQFKAIPPSRLILRLAKRRNLTLAFALCSRMNVSRDDVLNYWVIHKIKEMHSEAASDDDIRSAITTQIAEYTKTVSFFKAIRFVYTTLNRKNLAIRLLPLINDEHCKIDILIHLKQLRMAISTAISLENADTLTKVVAFVLKENPEFLKSLKTASEYAEIEKIMLLLSKNAPPHNKRSYLISMLQSLSSGTNGIAVP